MATKLSPPTNKVFQNHDDVHISIEDQQKINKFAKHNVRLDELKVELDMKKNSLKNVEDALEELELFDEDEEIPFLFGEVFITSKLAKTQELLGETKGDLLRKITRIEAEANVIKDEMAVLKTLLYQRFGNNISLESDE